MKTLIFLALLLSLSACSGKRVMKDCESLGQGFYQCEKP